MENNKKPNLDDEVIPGLTYRKYYAAKAVLWIIAGVLLLYYLVYKFRH